MAVFHVIKTPTICQYISERYAWQFAQPWSNDLVYVVASATQEKQLGPAGES